MSVGHEASVRDLGTKFLLFPQPPYLSGYADPERVWVSPRAGSIGPGPSDDRMYVIDPIEKPEPYEFPYLPPFRGDAHPPVEPDAQGHFDRLDPTERSFAAAHLYGSLRRVLDIWESYFGRRIDWFFHTDFERLEIIPMIDWHNAQSGYGYMEFGYRRDEEGRRLPFALNFDVIAHELGHAILFSEMGVPDLGERTFEFLAFHEACADLTALVSLLHFDSVADRLLRSTRGNLYTLNELNRIAELSDTMQLRVASNDRRLSQVTEEVHDLSRPFTGAVFDIMVEVFHDLLLANGLIDQRVAASAVRAVEDGQVLDRLQDAFDEAYRNRHYAFKNALFGARDIVGERMAYLWRTLPPVDLRYTDAALGLLEADAVLGHGRYERAIRESFAWRGILED